jgi:RimJ/RimL family protein N-acetyltransferase
MITLRPMHHRNGKLKNVSVRQFKKEDLLSLNASLTAAECRERFGPGITYLEGDKVIACFGATIIREGFGEVWLATSDLWTKYALEAVIWTRDFLDWLQHDFGLKRMQADVLAENHRARRFVEHYGFVAEGLMRHYDEKGRDMVRYARIREDDDGKQPL